MAVGGVSQATANANNNCLVNASGGDRSCADSRCGNQAGATSHHVAGRPYRPVVHGYTTGRWGPWQWNDADYHFVGVVDIGDTQARIDDLGTADPAAYDAYAGEGCG